MRILPEILAELAPSLRKLSPETLVERLTNLGFETEILAGKTPVLEVTFTPNRGDAMSHLGLARDLLAVQSVDKTTAPRTLTLEPTGIIDALPELSTPTLVFKPKAVCSQYHAVLFEKISVQPSPTWLQERLTLLGIRPINSVVDLTNYFMELYGQPLHAFDADALLGDTLTVRDSKAGEVVTTLDGVERKLPAGLAIIEDAEGLIDLAGIMGGANSQVQPTTTRVFLQAAIFDRSRIRRATNLLNYRTAASTRYERGVDPVLSIPVLERAMKMLASKEFGKASVVGKLELTTMTRRPKVVAVDSERVNGLLGMDVSTARQVQYLRLLGATVESGDGVYTVMPPTWRFDIEIWQDVAEEIARIVGLDDTLPAKQLPKLESSDTVSDIEWAEGIKDRLVEIGLSEVQTYSFVSAHDLEVFDFPVVGELANPLNPTLRFLRPSLIPNLATVIATNSVFDPVLIFEIGHVFGTETESTSLGIGIAGNTFTTNQWMVRIADALGMDSAQFQASVTITELDGATKERYKIRRHRVTLLEIPLESLRAARRIPKSYRIPQTIVTYRPLSKFPPIARDISLIVDRKVEAEMVRATIATSSPLVESVDLFDEYVSDRLGENKKSIAFHVYYADPSRTLTDQDIQDTQQSLEQALETNFDAVIR